LKQKWDGMCFILCDFFSNPSGHPAHNEPLSVVPLFPEWAKNFTQTKSYI
jgi:hypothetical protein